MARLQARLGVARLGATRLGDYGPRVTCYINSVAYHTGAVTGQLDKASLRVSLAEGKEPSTATLQLLHVSSPPVEGQRVYLGLGSHEHRIFAGRIMRRTQRQARQVEPPTWTFEAEGNHALLNRRLVRARYLSTDAGVLIKDLVARYTSGFTAHRVQANMGTVEEIEFTHTPMADAIQRVCDRVGARWYLDPYDDVHAFLDEESGASPAQAITASAPAIEWQHTTDLSQIRTRVYVKGGGHGASEHHIAGSTLLFLDDTLLLTGVSTVTIGRSFYAVSSVNRVAAPWFLVLSNSLSVGGLTEALPTGGMVEVFATAQDTAAQTVLAALEGGDGIHEAYVADGRLTQPGALDRANAELSLFKDPGRRGTYETRDPSAMPGRRLYLNVTSPTHVTSVTSRITRTTLTRFEERGPGWTGTARNLFPLRRVEYASQANKDLYQLLAELERARRTQESD